MSIQRCPNPVTWKLFYTNEDPDTFGLACDECILRIADDEGRAIAAAEPFEGERQCGQFAPIVLTDGAE